jgi:hypothetical protein
MEDPDLRLAASGVAAANPDDAPTREPSREPVKNPAQNPAENPDEEQTGIIPGKIPGQPTDPADPRFPGSQPDLA